MRPRSTTSTPGKEGSSQEQTLMWLSGTPRDPSMKLDSSIHRLAWLAAAFIFPLWSALCFCLILTGVSLLCISAHRTISVDNQFQGGDVNLYEGLRCHGVPLVTISRGRLVYENGIFTCAEGSGKFCPLRTFPDYLYKKMVQRAKVSDKSVFVETTRDRSENPELKCKLVQHHSAFSHLIQF